MPPKRVAKILLPKRGSRPPVVPNDASAEPQEQLPHPTVSASVTSSGSAPPSATVTSSAAPPLSTATRAAPPSATVPSAVPSAASVGTSSRAALPSASNASVPPESAQLGGFGFVTNLSAVPRSTGAASTAVAPPATPRTSRPVPKYGPHRVPPPVLHSSTSSSPSPPPPHFLSGFESPPSGASTLPARRPGRARYSSLLPNEGSPSPISPTGVIRRLPFNSTFMDSGSDTANTTTPSVVVVAPYSNSNSSSSQESQTEEPKNDSKQRSSRSPTPVDDYSKAIPKSSFATLVKSISEDYGDFRWETNAIAIMHEVAEAYLEKTFGVAHGLATHRRRKTVGLEDLQLAVILEQLLHSTALR